MNSLVPICRMASLQLGHRVTALHVSFYVWKLAVQQEFGSEFCPDPGPGGYSVVEVDGVAVIAQAFLPVWLAIATDRHTNVAVNIAYLDKPELLTDKMALHLDPWPQGGK